MTWMRAQEGAVVVALVMSVAGGWAAPAPAHAAAATEVPFVYARTQPSGTEVVRRDVDGSETSLYSSMGALTGPVVSMAHETLALTDHTSSGDVLVVMALDGTTAGPSPPRRGCASPVSRWTARRSCWTGRTGSTPPTS
jgi:hypothetical protein